MRPPAPPLPTALGPTQVYLWRVWNTHLGCRMLPHGENSGRREQDGTNGPLLVWGKPLRFVTMA